MTATKVALDGARHLGIYQPKDRMHRGDYTKGANRDFPEQF